jgi:hypothetical protein
MGRADSDCSPISTLSFFAKSAPMHVMLWGGCLGKPEPSALRTSTSDCSSKPYIRAAALTANSCGLSDRASFLVERAVDRHEAALRASRSCVAPPRPWASARRYPSGHPLNRH